jgi:hypothetical protein
MIDDRQQTTDDRHSHRHIWFIGTLAHWLIGSLAHWLIGSLAHWFIGSLAHWLIGTLAHWHIGSLTHRLSNFCINSRTFCKFPNTPATNVTALASETITEITNPE